MPFRRDTRVVSSNTVLDRNPGPPMRRGDLGVVSCSSRRRWLLPNYFGLCQFASAYELTINSELGLGIGLIIIVYYATRAAHSNSYIQTYSEIIKHKRLKWLKVNTTPLYLKMSIYTLYFWSWSIGLNILVLFPSLKNSENHIIMVRLLVVLRSQTLLYNTLKTKMTKTNLYICIV